MVEAAAGGAAPTPAAGRAGRAARFGRGARSATGRTRTPGGWSPIGSVRRGASTVRVEIGVPQQTPVRVAVERIRSGELDAALVVGGEAKATQLRRSRAGLDGARDRPGRRPSPTSGGHPRARSSRRPRSTPGMWQPVEQYACIDNALRARRGRAPSTSSSTRSRSCGARFNEVAGHVPRGGLPRATRRGVPARGGTGQPAARLPVREVAQHPVGGRPGGRDGAVLGRGRTGARRRRATGGCSRRCSSSRRCRCRCPSVADLHRWPAMQVLGAGGGRAPGPPARRARARRGLQLLPRGGAGAAARARACRSTARRRVMGAMAFAGGPFNNFTYQSTAAIVRRVRERARLRRTGHARCRGC